MSIKIERSKLLVVEGTHEVQFLNAAFRDHLHLNDIQVLPVGGKSNISENLRVLVKDASFPAVNTLAIMRDADQSASTTALTAAQSSLISLRQIATNAGLQPPSAHGTFSNATPRVGFFIMPDGVRDGALETLCVEALRADNAYACVSVMFECLSAQGIVPRQLDKAHVHAWLASRPWPDLHIGLAAKEGYWNWNNAAFDELWKFLKAM